MQKQKPDHSAPGGAKFVRKAPLVELAATGVFSLDDLRTLTIEAALSGKLDRTIAKDVLAAIPKPE